MNADYYARRSMWVFTIVCAVIVLVVVRSWWSEWGSKAEWSALQGAEARTGDGSDHLVLHSESGDCFAGIWGRNGLRRTWFLLNARYDPIVKQMPRDVEFEITASEVNRIEEFCAVNPVVTQELKRHEATREPAV